MIRKLQKRFILITVLALTVAMMLVVGIVNVANLLSVRAELSGTVHMLAGMGVPGDLPQMLSERRDRWDDDDDREDDLDDRPEGAVPPGLRTRHDRNMVLESNWFVVHLDGNNAVRSVSRLSASDLTEEEAMSLAERALAAGRESGYLGDELYLIQDSPLGRKIVFLNCETRLSSVRTLALISGLACLGGILLALLLVSLLSRRAVEPTIRNMEQQKQFITDAGHELKTPLTVISTNMELIDMEHPDNPWVKSTRKQTAGMARLVDELVYLSRMEEEHPALERESVSLGILLEETAEPFEAMAEYQGKIMAVQADPDLRVTGDRASLQRLLSTLCDNAVKYAPEGGDIRAEAFAEGRSALVRVSNTVQMPLTREQCARLFQRFYRADPSRSKEKQKGFGIGLSIAAAIAEKHGGTIRAEMEGERLAITCTLPREK